MARFCTSRGKGIPDGVALCTGCGAKAPAAQPKTYFEACAAVAQNGVCGQEVNRDTLSVSKTAPFQRQVDPIRLQL